MPRIIARLVLACAVVLAAPVLDFILFFIINGLSQARGGTRDLLLSSAGAAAFFIPAWIGVWREEVSWTASRRQLTALSVLWCIGLSSGIGLLVSMSVRYSGEEIGVIMGSMIWLPAWMASTALVWRETRAERRRRVSSLRAGRVWCPECKYDLTGLHEARCPECGTQYTLDQLFATAVERAGAFRHKDI